MAEVVAYTDVRLEVETSTGTWTNIVGPTRRIKVERADSNLGLLEAEVLDAALDPTATAALRPGKAVRLRVVDGAGWRALFTGEITDLDVEEDPTAKPGRQVKVGLTASDAVHRLANTPERRGVGSLDALRWLLTGVVPFRINGSSVPLAEQPVIATNDNASAWSQILITRDTALGYVWVDPEGRLCGYDRAALPSAAVAALTPTEYGTISKGFELSQIVNTVEIQYQRINLANGATVTVPYGPYVDQASVDQWGTRSATFTIQGGAEDPVAIKAYADTILAANATAQARVKSVRVPIRDTGDLVYPRVIDLHSRVDVTLADGVTVLPMRAVGITHEISSVKGSRTRWLMDLDFVPTGTVSAPVSTPGTGVAYIPAGSVANDQLDPAVQLVLSQAQADIDHLNTVTIPGINTTLAENAASLTGLEGRFPVVGVDIADDAISAPKIAANAVTADKIIANAVGADELAANAVTTAKLAALAVSADKLAANAVTADKIAANAVTAGKIAANSIDVQQLRVGFGGNWVANPGFEEGLDPHYYSTVAPTINTSIPHSGARFCRFIFTSNITSYHLLLHANGNYQEPSRHPRCAAGQRWRWSFWAYAYVNPVDVTAVVGVQDVNGNSLQNATHAVSLSETGGWTKVTVEIEITHPAAAYVVGIVAVTRATSGPSDPSLLVDDMELVRMTTGDLIVNGAIDGKTITGALIRTGPSGAHLELQPGGLLAGYSGNPSEATPAIIQPGSGGAFGNGTLLLQSPTFGANAPAQILLQGSVTPGLPSSVALHGQVFAPNSPGAAIAANVYMDGNGGIYKSVSSQRYKDQIAPAAIDPDAVLGLEPKHFTLKNDTTARRYVGVIAEEAEALGLTDWIEYDDQGRPESFGYANFCVALLAVARRQRDQIADLTARVTALEQAPTTPAPPGGTTP